MKRLVLIAAVAAGTLAAGAASAQEGQWYVQANGGAAFDGQLKAEPQRQTDAGWGVSGEAGRDFGNGWRASVEALYLDANNKHGQSGQTSVVGGFANVYYDFLRDTPWRPFVGVGVGGAQVTSQGDNGSNFAYQAKVGVDHPFNEHLIGEVAYRYVDVTDVRGGLGSNRFDGDYDTSAVTVGLRYNF
jgi:opacity protein-like surface antigen